MKIVITGATGFIGRLLVKKHIDLGDEVHILTRRRTSEFNEKVNIHIGDLSNMNSLTNFIDSVDVLYHCAAEIKNDSLMGLTNIEGTKNLIKIATSNVKHWIQLSSTGVYGSIYDGIVNENQNYNPVNEYERTKLESDLLVIEAAKNNSFRYTIIRPTNVFDFRMTNKSIFQLVRAIDKGLYFYIGPKGASANYVPVENVIECMFIAANQKTIKNEIYIISNWTTIEFFIETIAKALERPLPKLRFSKKFIKFLAKIFSFIPKSPLTISRVNALTNRVKYDISKVENELNYKPVVTLEDTINELVRFYKINNDFKKI